MILFNQSFPFAGRRISEARVHTGAAQECDEAMGTSRLQTVNTILIGFKVFIWAN